MAGHILWGMILRSPWASSVLTEFQARGPTIALAPETDAGAADVGDAPLSLDDAVGLLDHEDDSAAPDGDAQSDTEQDPADDQTAADEDAPDDDDPASEDDGDDDGSGQAEATGAPEFWSAEEKALFATAPPEVQQLVAAKTKEAEKRVYEAKEEAAAARKDASIIAEVREVVDQQVQRAQEIFRGRWEGVDWAAWSQENPTEAFQAKLQFDQEQEELARLQTAAAATEAEEHRTFLKAEHAKLVEAKHPLADPEKGNEAKKALVDYAEAHGYTREDLRWAGARELTTLHKAFLYDQAQARLATKPPKQTPSEAARKPGAVRPAGAPPTRRETQAKQRQSLLGRAYKTGKIDDAVAYLDTLE